jgi:hypothetical protein
MSRSYFGNDNTFLLPNSWVVLFFINSTFYSLKILFTQPFSLSRGAGATGAAGATAPVAQTLRGQHGGNRLPFLPELHLEICA